MTKSTYRLCCIIPCYNNSSTIRTVAGRVRQKIDDIIIVNDGSNEETTAEIIALEKEGFRAVHRSQNGGKGAAVKSGFQAAQDAGFTHALQIDADGQHDLDLIPTFMEISKKAPDSLLLGHPLFDDSAPKLRLWARKITIFWTHVETLGFAITDPMCGFRIYPVDAAIEAAAKGNYMEFDIEIAVKIVRLGVPVINVPVPVRYLTEEEGGISHFRMWEDNFAITRTHVKLVLSAIPWALKSSKKR